MKFSPKLLLIPIKLYPKPFGMAKSLEKLKKELQTAFLARHPLVGVISEDELQVLELLKDPEVSGEFILLIYDEAGGLEVVNENSSVWKEQIEAIKETAQAIGNNLWEVLEFVAQVSKEIPTLLVLKSADKLFSKDDSETIKLLRALKNLVNETKRGNLNLTTLFLMEELKTFPLLGREILILYLDFPDREEIREILEDFLQREDIRISETLKVELVSALQGLTRSEIENLLYLAYFNDYSLNENDLDFIFDYKKQVVSKRGILEFIDLRKLPDDVGGLKNLKEWLKRKKRIFENLDEAIKNGVAIPKGVLLFGMPGCGKSMTAKYTAKLLKLPLLRLDMGKIMGPYLGQSEENMRKAIAIAEAISPSILWIDEIEKALSGVKGGGQTNDTLVRIFGTLLTWMQEKEKPVFVIATANDISMLPPEFLRKGRFDEIFFVDFPTKEEMKEIFTIHLKRTKQNPSDIDLDKVIEHLEEGYSGADIEAIVNETVERVFLEGRKQITTEDLIKTVKEGTIKPTKELLKDSIEELRKKLEKINARKAN